MLYILQTHVTFDNQNLSWGYACKILYILFYLQMHRIEIVHIVIVYMFCRMIRFEIKHSSICNSNIKILLFNMKHNLDIFISQTIFYYSFKYLNIPNQEK